jgi:hypothetical protein
MLAGAVMLAHAAAVTAQDKPSPPAAELRPIPLRVQVVISRFQGEKKIASAPYMLAITARADPRLPELARLRIGTEVPIATPPAPPSTDGKTPAGPAIQYRPVGTNIDCNVVKVDDASFGIQLTIEQSSVVDDEPKPQAARVPNAPAFRSFRFTNSAVLRDGQTTQFTNAADALTGEVVRVDVTLNVVK